MCVCVCVFVLCLFCLGEKASASVSANGNGAGFEQSGEAVNGCLIRAAGSGRKEKKATGRIGIGTGNPHGSEVEAEAVNSLREKGVESRAWLRLEASIH